jgi:hypothetical protein
MPGRYQVRAAPFLDLHYASPLARLGARKSQTRLRRLLVCPSCTTAAANGYVFVLGGGRGGGGAVDHSKALDAPRWTEVVKTVLKRHAGVPLAPKDLRSSFITFLLSDANTDEALKKARWRTRCATRRRSRARRRTTRTAPSARGPRPCRWRARSPRASRP